MLSKPRVSINVKFLSLVAIESIFFLVITTVFVSYENMKLKAYLDEKAIANASYIENIISLRNIISLSNEPLKSVATDYFFYNNILKIFNTQDKKSKLGAILRKLETLDIDYIWIFNEKQKLIYFKNTQQKPDVEAIFSGNKLLFDSLEKPASTFFHRLQDGTMLEVVAVAVYPLADVQRKTAPKGYLFIARLWDAQYLMELSNLTASNVNFDIKLSNIDQSDSLFPHQIKAFYLMDLMELSNINQSDSLFPHQIKAFYDYRSGSYIFKKPLYGWNKQVEGILVFNSGVTATKKITDFFNVYFIFFIVFTFLIIATFFFFINRWVIKPINTITEALESETPEKLRIPYEHKEFFEIALLTKKCLAHLNSLAKEINSHEQTKIVLKTFEAIFESSLFAAVLHKNNGRIIACSAPALKLFGYEKSQLLQMRMTDIVPQYYSHFEFYTDLNAQKTEQAFREIVFMRLHAKRKDGSTFFADIQIRKVSADNDHFFYCIMTELPELD